MGVGHYFTNMIDTLTFAVYNLITIPFALAFLYVIADKTNIRQYDFEGFLIFAASGVALQQWGSNELIGLTIFDFDMVNVGIVVGSVCVAIIVLVNSYMWFGGKIASLIGGTGLNYYRGEDENQEEEHEKDNEDLNKDFEDLTVDGINERVQDRIKAIEGSTDRGIVERIIYFFK